jgi:pyruvate,water dikinase
MTQTIVALDGFADVDVAAFGAKATTLARLRRAGIRVPEAFALGVSWWRAHRDAHEFGARVAAATALPPERRVEALAALREEIATAPPPTGLDAALEEWIGWLGPGAVAVRSSATAEDGAERSFAGQHDTSLAVVGPTACLEHVRRVWSSLFTERAVAYREQHGIAHDAIDMAVIVQKLVIPDVAGVAFTVDPTRPRSRRLIIEASYGLGEAVVSGRVTPDQIVVDRTSLRVRERRAGRKDVEIVPSPHGGVHEQPVAGDRAAATAIDDRSARLIASLSMLAERAVGPRLDVEWALTGRTVHVLQARPITGLDDEGSWESRQLWTNANAGEVVPDVLTPLTLSILRPVVDELFVTVSGLIGVDMSGVPVLRIIAGRPYFNVNTTIAVMRRLPGAKDRSMSELFGGRQDDEAVAMAIPEEDLPDVRLNLLRAAFGVPRLVVGLVLHGPRRGARYITKYRRETERRREEDTSALSTGALARRTTDDVRGLLRGTDPFLFLGVGVMHSMALFTLCRRWFGDEGDALASRLLAGTGGLEHAEAGYALCQLARSFGGTPALRAVLETARSEDDLERGLADAPGGAAVRDAWRAFMSTHGHHTRGEVELANPRWSERPAYVLEMVRGLVDCPDEVDPIARTARVAADREAAEAACRKRLGPLRRALFGAVLKRARRGLPIRENLKNEIVRRLALIRTRLLELGDRLVTDGLFETADDVFFVGVDGLVDACDAEHAARTRRLVATRRVAYDHACTLDPPSLVRGGFDPDAPAPPPASVGADGVLRGLAVSAGVAAGPARVILHAAGGRLEPGEVLVAPFTDPGWTPYFLGAAAIVMDMGGILSHGAIVARELGIPCVVNVTGATTTFATGERIRVDGTKGVVQRGDA